MRLSPRHCLLSWLIVICVAPVARSATTITGVNMAMKSGGSGTGDWTLDRNGYVGTYVQLDAPGEVTIAVQSSGLSSGGIAPHMNIVVADTKAGFDVGTAFSSYEHTFSLPAGTYFVRTEMDNDAETSSRALTVRNVSISGATVFNVSTNSNALDAADTYISNFRKGNVTVGLSGVAPGTSVDVNLKRHAFNFGTAVAGSNFSTLMNPNPTPGTDAYRYQQALKTQFNALVPENAGKWSENEYTRDSQWMPQLDKIVNFAVANDKRLRMHNLIWGTQQPSWVNTLISQAASGNTSARNELRVEISERIDYYVGDGVGADRAQNYVDLDVYNESVHTASNSYWDIYGADGVADIYNEVAQAIEDAGAGTHLFANEYNVMQDSSDYYGNWYREHIEEIVTAGGEVSGVGVQSYENNAIGTSADAHYPARKMQTLQNLSVLGMPIVLTEFGVKDPTSQADAATMLDDTARLVFGTPDASGFMMWGFWRGDIYRGAAALYDSSWNLTAAGQLWQDLFSIDTDGDRNDDWDTQLTAVVGADGTISFDGFWGDYELTVGGVTYDLTLSKNDLLYSLVVAPGDYNGDGTVDAADYSVWRDTFGSSDDLRADGNGDGVVDDGDYGVWKALFGTTYGTGAGSLAAAVPEPASAVLLLAGLLLILCRPPVPSPFGRGLG
jgi:GH35 family endo-1,4-beta-xylanase